MFGPTLQRIAWVIGAAGFAPWACGGALGFVCGDDADCADGSRAGTCEPTGACSFPDDECPSGSRYGAHAGNGLAGECVDDGGTGSETTSATTNPSITDEPTTATHGSGDPTELTLTSVDPMTTTSTTGAPAVCGNGVVEAGEQCDGAVDLDCTALGHSGGVLLCSATCKFDEEACTDCGNGVLENDSGEACDGMDFGAATCADHGFIGGELGCGANCQLDTSMCHNCGDGVVGPGEECDGALPDEWSCGALGLGMGQLACLDCDLSIEGCDGVQCGVDPPDAFGDCPPECDACVEGTCVISCVANSACTNESIVCPWGYDCEVVCEGNSSCANVDVSCTDVWGCRVSCNGNSACANLDVDCGEAGECSLYCEYGTSVCTGAGMNCGIDTCVATCGMEVSDIPDVDCAGICGCSTCGD
jgi:hypothetical protein